MIFGGIYLTSLVRTPEQNLDVGGVPTSKHVKENCASGKAEAALLTSNAKGN